MFDYESIKMLPNFGIKKYADSVYRGELDDNKNITFRNSIVGPDLNEKGIGLLNWFMLDFFANLAHLLI